MTELATADLIRPHLPPIRRNDVRALTQFDARVALDCEWDRNTGELTLVGVGNLKQIVHLWWAELDDEAKWIARGAVLRVIQDCPVVYQNADADIRKLRQFDFEVTVDMHAQLDDTMLAHAVLHAEDEHTLEYLTETYGKLPQHKHLREIDPEVYNACDLLETLFVLDALAREFALDPAAERIYRTQSLAKLPYLIDREERGIRVNKALVYPLRDKFDQRRQQAAALARAYCGWPLNLGSPDQMKQVLYAVEKFPVQLAKAAPGDEGNPTTGKDALAQLRRMVGTEWDPDDPPTLDTALENVEAGGHPVLEARYLYYGAQQAISHYIDPCLVFEGETIVGVRDRIYPETRQHVQTSGRESVVGPALQQLRGELENLIEPDPGTVWLGWDWSNIETWLLGGLSGDTLILEAKAKGWDTHTLNYCDISGTPYPPILTKAIHAMPCTCGATVIAAMCGTHLESCPVWWRERVNWTGDEDMRRVFAKRYVYRLHYRGKPENAGDIPGAKALGFNAGRLVEASQRYLNKHHWIVEWWKRIEYDVDHFGVIYTFMGRPRRLTSPYRNARYREGSNHPMQGGVADIYNETRLLIHELLPWLEFVYGKHDSQWWQCPVDRVDEAWATIKPVVQREFVINGTPMSFPASFKERKPA